MTNTDIFRSWKTDEWWEKIENEMENYSIKRLKWIEKQIIQEDLNLQESLNYLNRTNPKKKTPVTVEEAEKQIDIFHPPPKCIWLKHKAHELDFNKLKKYTDNFDAIVMDPPWRLAQTKTVRRGVHLGFGTMSFNQIHDMNLKKLSSKGMIFVWTVNFYYPQTIKLIENWGYKFFESFCWLKVSNTNRTFKGNGYAFQHSKEHCIIGIKGNPKLNIELVNSLISPRKGQSRKPEKLYEIIKSIFPDGIFLEIFARRNNLRDGFLSVGLEF
ncbi:mt-a70 family protein [Anaeramoeba flamelloides]|uniref:mRNA m(6)A methyltransferase n=1 Tax=Anaeramoeba flamelloides TaxID=1746091 RepID=A0ABQ8Y2A8_9EUKA|nr:mt-a70 family protein [Anaeramoeba flamelloides]